MKSTLGILAFWLASASLIFAHAFVDHASPSVGSALHAPPAEVEIWFTEKLVLPFSDLRVTDPSGKQVDKRDKHADLQNGAALIVSLPRLAPGKYTVSWRAASVDTHVTTGTFTFELSH